MSDFQHSNICFVEATHHQPCGCVVTSDVTRIRDCSRCLRPDRILSAEPPEDSEEVEFSLCEPVVKHRVSAAPCFACIEEQRAKDRERDRQMNILNRNIILGVANTWVPGSRTGRATDIRPRAQENYCIVCLVAEPKLKCMGYGPGMESCDGNLFCIACWHSSHKDNARGHRVCML